MTGTLAPRKPRNVANWRRSPLWNMQEMLEEMVPGWLETPTSWLTGELTPSADISETDKTVEIEMDLPGFVAKDVDIQLNNNILTIKGQREEKTEEKGKTFHRVERRAGTFSRSFALPCAVVDDEGAAEFRDGVLKITLPKAVEAQSRKIKVKA